MPTPLTEHISDWRTPAVEVDASQRIVRNVALAGSASRNGYTYSEAALREAAPLYVNKPVFLDHPRAAGRPLDRSARDLVGSIVNPRYEDGRIRGDVQTLDTDAGRTFLALAQADQPAVGMSHIVLADRHENTIDRIHEVLSVDAVVFPATTHSLREQSPNEASVAEDTALPPSPPLRGRGAGGEGADAPTNTPTPIDATPPLLNSLSPPLEPAPRPLVEPSSLDAGRDARLAHAPPSPMQRAGFSPPPSPPLRGRGAGGEGADVAAILARLPPAALTPLFEQQLREAPDEPARQALLHDRILLLERLTPRTTSPPRRDDPSPTSDDRIIAAIRNR